MSCAPRHTPRAATPAPIASRRNCFSAFSQGNVASSLTLIGPPIAITRSSPRASGNACPAS